MLSSKRSSLHRAGALKGLFSTFLVLLLTVSCGGGSSAADSAVSKEDASQEQAVQRLLPAADEVAGWRPDGAPMLFSGDRLFEHINGGADIYYEYGFATLVVQRYAKEDKAVSIEIYGMNDPGAAFGIYSYNRHPTLSPIDVGTDGAIHPSGLFFWQGRYHVDIRRLGSVELLGEEFVSIAKAIEEKIESSPEPPAIMKLLPSDNMVERSTVFARGKLAINNQVYVASRDLFGLKEGETAAIARYRLGMPEFSVIIAEYASDEARGEAFKRLRAHFLGEESVREKFAAALTSAFGWLRRHFLGEGSVRELEFAAAPTPGKHYAVREAGRRLLVVANADSERNALVMLDRLSDHIKAK